MDSETYLCSTCGQAHPGLPLAYGADAPAHWYGMDEAEQAQRWELTPDAAILDGCHFFIRGRLELPIAGHHEPFSWDVWVSLSAESFARTEAMWNVEGREREPPCFGWVSTTLPGYPSTLNLRSRVHTRPVGLAPFVELEPTEHPLAVEQRRGITWDRVREIAAQVQAGG